MDTVFNAEFDFRPVTSLSLQCYDQVEEALRILDLFIPSASYENKYVFSLFTTRTTDNHMVSNSSRTLTSRGTHKLNYLG